jgi:hypothetical protein
MPGGEGRVRCPRAELRSAPGRSGHHACRHYDRRAGCIAGSGRVAAGRARAVPCPTKHGPGCALGMRYSPWQEPWWNAGRRARPTADGSAQADLIRGATAPAGAGLTTVRLPAFRFLFSFVLSYFVIAGHSRSKNGVASLAYAPAIHAAKRLEHNSDWLTLWHVSMDHRVKPGGDEGAIYCCLTKLAHKCAARTMSRDFYV